MPSTYDSSGCFPGQTAIRSVSAADLRKLTYSTAYKTGCPGKVSRPEDKWENFINVHDVGKKDTPYLKYQRCTAPLLDRSALTNMRDFVALPLGDNIINAELAENFKNGLKGGAAGLDVSANHKSCYKEEYAGHSPERARAAKPKNFKPKQSRTSTITGMTDMMEKQCLSHVTYNTPDASLAKAAEIVLAKPNIGLPGSWMGAPPKTSYKHDYAGMQPVRSVPNLHTGKEDPRMKDLVPDDHPSFTMRRMCYMSPGQ